MEYLDKEHELFAYERRKHEEGCLFVAGTDEAGRGPLAGPVVAAALVFPPDVPVPAVNDSKKLSDRQRRELRDAIVEIPDIDFSVVEVYPDEIDRINILRASQQAMIRAVGNLKRVDFVLIDGLPVPGFPFPCEAIVKGDSKSASIAAASILAKVHRDEYMEKISLEYPGYGFEKHKGYGTAEHLEALKKLGPSAVHRKSFAPVRDIIEPPPEQQEFSF